MTCHHDYTLDSIDAEQHQGQPRMAYLKCVKCDSRLARLTTRTDAEIAAELAAQQS